MWQFIHRPQMTVTNEKKYPYPVSRRPTIDQHSLTYTRAGMSSFTRNRWHGHRKMESQGPTCKSNGQAGGTVDEMGRYKCDILRLCEMRWKLSGEITKDMVHIVYYSGREDKN